MRTQAVSMILLLLLTPVLDAQQVNETVQVVLVEIPVHVVDRAGNSMKGLTAENFEVLDEGKKRPITHFEAIDLTAPVTERERLLFNPAARRNFLLLFDQSYSSPGTIERAAEAAREFIRKGIADRDLVGIASFSVERGFDWVISFTTDRESLLKAVDAVGTSKMVQSADPLALSVLIPPAEVSSGSTAGREARQAAEETAADISRRVGQSNDEIQRARIRHQLGHFSRLARVLDRVRGQKQVILLSEGFDARLLQGRESTGGAQDTADAEASIRGEVWTIDNDQRFGNTAAVNVLDQMGNIFRRSDVVLHAIDIKGLRVDVDAREGRKASSSESLFLLANPTGGQLFKNTNDVSENFERMLRQQQIVYVLGFQVSSSATPGKFHNLKVRVRDVPGARVHHRAGYYEPTLEASPIERTLSAVEILMNDIPRDELAVDMMAAPFPAEIGNPQVPVILEIGGPSVLEAAAGSSVDGEIFIYAFDQDSSVRDFLYQKVSLDLTKVRDRLNSSGVKFYGALNLPPGVYDVKGLVRIAQTGRAGFKRMSLEVPDFNKPVVLAPFVVGVEGTWIMIKAAPRRPAEVDYPFTISSQSFVPRAAARMRSSESYEIALFGYQLQPEGLELSVKVRDGAHAERPANIALVGRTPSGASGPMKLLFNFKPAGLSAGTYALDFTVKAKDQPDTQRVTVPFVVN